MDQCLMTAAIHAHERREGRKDNAYEKALDRLIDDLRSALEVDPRTHVQQPGMRLHTTAPAYEVMPEWLESADQIEIARMLVAVAAGKAPTAETQARAQKVLQGAAYRYANFYASEYGGL